MPRSTRIAVVACAAALTPAAAASAAPPPPPAENVIVTLRPGTPAAAERAVLGAGQEVGRVHGTDARVLRVGNPVAAAARLQRNPNVAHAEVDVMLQATAIPDDPRFGALYGMDRIDAPEAWDALGLGGFPASGGPKVGIVDTGIRATHEDLAGRTADCAGVRSRGGRISLVAGACADGNGHGTHVAGTIAATANNGRGVAGVSFGSSLAICKGLSDSGSGSTSAIASCIRWLRDRGVRVISMSLGGGSTLTLQDAVRYASTGALLVAAAGNDGDGTLNYPAAYPEVVSVAATDAADARASFSNANADVELAAPGVGITSTWSTSDTAYATISGTSMATPHAAGVAALLAQRLPDASAATLRARLTAAVDDLGPAGRDPQFGFGRVDALQAATE